MGKHEKGKPRPPEPDKAGQDSGEFSGEIS